MRKLILVATAGIVTFFDHAPGAGETMASERAAAAVDIAAGQPFRTVDRDQLHGNGPSGPVMIDDEGEKILSVGSGLYGAAMKGAFQGIG